MAPGDDDRFIAEYRPLVERIARRVRAELDLNCDLEDLVAFGYRGLVEARGRFDPSRGAQFKTFAFYRIRGAVLDGVREMAYMPRRAYARLRAAEAADLVLEHRGEAQQAAGAAATASSPGSRAAAAAIDETLAQLTAGFVLAAVGQGEDDGPADPEERLMGSAEAARVRAALAVLPERERRLVDGFYFEGKRFDAVAAELGISKSWASRLHSKALALLKDALSD